MRLVKRRMGLHRYDDDFLSMGIAEIEVVVVNLREEVEELGKDKDSLDGDRDCDSHRHDVEEVNEGNRKTVLHLFAGRHGCP